MPKAKRKKPHNPARAHDRRARDLLRNAEVATVEVDNPLALEPGEKIVALRSIRNDPLGRLHSHRQIDEAQYQGGRAFQDDWEKAERGPRAVDPTREYVDGGQRREPITESQRKAVLRLNRAERELGADGSALVHDVLVQGLTMEQIGLRRGLRTQRWNDYFSRRFRECLDRLALLYGYATEHPIPVKTTPRVTSCGRGWAGRHGARTDGSIPARRDESLPDNARDRRRASRAAGSRSRPVKYWAGSGATPAAPSARPRSGRSSRRRPSAPGRRR